MTQPTPFTDVALAFAFALTMRQFRKAHAMLSRELKQTLSIKALRIAYDNMLNPEPDHPVEVQLIETLSDWPTKAVHDVGWAYVAMTWGRYAEAVTVIVEQTGNRPDIRHIEWGRP
ncbi:MAG: hypothetical protein KIH69_000235 [Anaerolineae bacterium]|nr:hypothetical protein [Anaerolineae bacterium]